MTEQQANVLRSTATMLEDIADIVEQELSPLDTTDEIIDNPAGTETAYGQTWTDLKQCVESYLETTSVDETFDSSNQLSQLNHLMISGRHPDGDRELKFTLRHYQKGSVLMTIGLPSPEKMTEIEGLNDSPSEKDEEEEESNSPFAND